MEEINKDNEYEIINNSLSEKNNHRKKATWSTYFKKIYMVSIILTISIVVYVYYIYKK